MYDNPGGCVSNRHHQTDPDVVRKSRRTPTGSSLSQETWYARSEFSNDSFHPPAELFRSRSRNGNRPPGYRRFETAAEAIRFAVEEMSSDNLNRAILECNEERFDGTGILELYHHADYPLARKPK
jgi:hypothetical protein